MARSLVLEEGSTTLGRGAEQMVVVRDPVVSRQHAVIVREGEAYSVVDQKSTHGTFVNGVRVERAVLRSGDVVRLGSPTGMAIEFHLEGVRPSSRSGASDLLTALGELSKSVLRPSAPAPELAQLNWLLEAARRLNEVGAIDDVLGALLQSALELTGLERGFVFVQMGGELQLRRGRDAAGEEVRDDSTISRRAVERAIASTAAFSVSDTGAGESPMEWPSVVAKSIRSIYCIPLRKLKRKRGGAGEAEGLLGLLYLDSQVGAGRLTAVDHQLLEMIATEAAALLHNALLAEEENAARKAREELAVAATIHSGLMATALPQLPYAAVEARSVPCLAIGGDFYDAVALEGAVGVTIADVSGKGVSAAIVAATLQGIIHAQMLSGQSLPEIASLVNQFLCGRSVGKYATMVMLKLYADGRLEYLNCGHIQPLVVYRGGEGVEVRRLEEGNLVVGLVAGAGYMSTTCQLRAEESVLLATDGVTEAEDAAGVLFGEHLAEAMKAGGDLDGLLRQVAAYQGAEREFQDDCTLQVRYVGRG